MLTSVTVISKASIKGDACIGYVCFVHVVGHIIALHVCIDVIMPPSYIRSKTISMLSMGQ